MTATEVVPGFVVDRKKTAHIVDDVAPIRDSTRLLLEAHGFSALTFASGTGYLASGVVGEVECMLFDVHMPGMTGIELLNSIRSRGIDTPAVVMTADGLRVAPRFAKQINRSIVFNVRPSIRHKKVKTRSWIFCLSRGYELRHPTETARAAA